MCKETIKILKKFLKIFLIKSLENIKVLLIFWKEIHESFFGEISSLRLIPVKTPAGVFEGIPRKFSESQMEFLKKFLVDNRGGNAW